MFLREWTAKLEQSGIKSSSIISSSGRVPVRICCELRLGGDDDPVLYLKFSNV